jgi:phosphopentomutase
MKRTFLIVLDSFGIGEMPDAAAYGDAGSNTLAAIAQSERFNCPNMTQLGLFNIEGVTAKPGVVNPEGSYARMAEKGKGKDTTVGHWEIAGYAAEKALPVYENGFPEEVIRAFEEKTGRKVICNKPYSGTAVLTDYGQEHEETGALIVYTSADSVFQIAAHEEHVSVEELYRYCEIARNEVLVGEHAVGRVIARPFIGSYPNYTRTSNRHDYSLLPPVNTMLDVMQQEGLETIGIGKIYDIFGGRGVSEKIRTKNNDDGMEETLDIVKNRDFNGLCFVNLVDFDMVYGHRNNIEGYAQAATDFDKQLGEMLDLMREDDVLIITADHGCDPSTPSTDHSREHTPMLIYGNTIKAGVDLKTRSSFADISATILERYGILGKTEGTSFLNEVTK